MTFLLGRIALLSGGIAKLLNNPAGIWDVAEVPTGMGLGRICLCIFNTEDMKGHEGPRRKATLRFARST
jgi:hypothetical protein